MKKEPQNGFQNSDPTTDSRPLHIYVESKIAGDRPVFFCSLPLIPAIETPARKILVVDGNSEVARMIGSLCVASGYQSIVTTSSREALSIAQKNTFSLFIIDYHLHRENGLMLICKLRELGFTAPALVMIDRPDIARFMQPPLLNIARVLVKPFDLPTFRTAVGESIDREY